MGSSYGRTQELKESILRHDMVSTKTLLQEEGIKLNDATKGPTPLYLAAQEGRLDITDLLLRCGAHVDCGTATETPLHLAARKANAELCQRLLAANADIKVADSHQHTALCNAVHSDDVETVFELLKAGSDPNQPYSEAGELNVLNSTVLIQAVKCGKIEIIAMLLKYGADVNIGDTSGRKPLHYAVIRGNDVAVLLVSRPGVQVDCADHDDVTPLHIACKIGDQSIVPILLDAGCNMNPATKMKSLHAGHFTPLHLAVLHSQANIVQLLCDTQQHFSVCQTEPRLNLDSTDTCQRTPLSHACERGLTEIVSILLCNGSDPNIVDYAGDSSLVYACKRGHVAVAKELLRNGTCDVNKRGASSRTALHHASERGYQEICEALISSGASILCSDRYGITPLKYSISNGSVGAVSALLKAGHTLPERNVEVSHILQMVNVAKANRCTILKMLVSAGWRPILSGFQKFTQIVDHVNADSAMIGWLEYQLYHPMKLQDCCRLVIRREVVECTKGILTYKAIETLPVPTRLKSYLLLCDIDIQQSDSVLD